MLKMTSRARRNAAQGLVAMGFMLASHSAMAGNWVSDAFAGLADTILIGLAGIAIFFGMAYMTIVTLAVFMISDATLVISAIFLPFALAFYPIMNSWATSAVGAIVTASMIKVAGAFFVNELLKNNGVIATALNKATQALAASAGPNGVGFGDAVGPVFQVAIGVVVIFMISALVIQSIPGIVSSVFGGFSIHTPSFGGAKALSVMAGAASGGAAGFLGGIAGGGSVKGALKQAAIGALQGNKGSAKMLKIASGAKKANTR